MEEETKLKWYEYPLFLPQGSVRAMLALGLVYGVTYMISQGIGFPEYIKDAMFVVIGFYFGTRK